MPNASVLAEHLQRSYYYTHQLDYSVKQQLYLVTKLIGKTFNNHLTIN